jgi:hypothetical protein
MAIDAHLPLPPASSAHPSVDDSTLLATFDDYDAAIAVIDLLAQAHFPVEQVSIVGHGVETVEQVTGRFGPAHAAARGALNGALVGLFFGLLFDWWGAIAPAAGWGWLAFGGLAYGAFVGGNLALLLELLVPRRRDFVSARSLTARHYDVVLTGGDRAAALRILGLSVAR